MKSEYSKGAQLSKHATPPCFLEEDLCNYDKGPVQKSEVPSHSKPFNVQIEQTEY